MNIFLNADQERVKSWLPLSFVVTTILTLIFLEGLSLGGYTLVEISHIFASVTMIVTCFLAGAHLTLFVPNKNILITVALALVSGATLLAVMYVQHSYIPLSCGLIVAFSIGVLASNKKRCWFTHAVHN